MSRLRSIVAVLALGALALRHAPASPVDSLESRLLAQGRLSELRGVQELKSWFNAYRGRPRLIFLLSPT
jgi:hypothetical protein